MQTKGLKYLFLLMALLLAVSLACSGGANPPAQVTPIQANQGEPSNTGNEQPTAVPPQPTAETSATNDNSGGLTTFKDQEGLYQIEVPSDWVYKQVTGENYDWFFNAYLYEASLPVLTETRDGNRLNLAWSTPAGIFPMPVEVEINGETRVVEMPGGRGSIETPVGAIVIVDPENKVLRQLDAVDQLQAFRRRPRATQ